MKKNISLAFVTSFIGGPLLTLSVEVFLLHTLATDGTLELAAIAVAMMAIGVLVALVFAVFICVGVYRRKEWGLITSAVMFSMLVFVAGMSAAQTRNQFLDTVIFWSSTLFAIFLMFAHVRELRAVIARENAKPLPK